MKIRPIYEHIFGLLWLIILCIDQIGAKDEGKN